MVRRNESSSPFGHGKLFKEKLYLGEAMLAVMFGILLGPYDTNLVDPRSWGQGASFNEVTLEITRIVVALDVFSTGMELTPVYLLRHRRTMTCLLGPVVLAGWFVGTNSVAP